MVEGAKFCQKCGATQVVNEEATDGQSKIPPAVKSEPAKNNLPVLARLCRGLSILRFVDSGVWVLIIIIQISLYGVESVGSIIWNIAQTALTVYLAVKLLPSKYIAQYDQYKQYDQDDMARTIGYNMGLSILALFWYVVQFVVYDSYIMIPLLVLEVVIIIISVLAVIKLDKAVRKSVIFGRRNKK